MTDDNREAAEKLGKLGDRVRRGWAKLHPLPEKHLAAVRAAVRQGWDQEQADKAVAKAPQAVKPARATHRQSPAKTKQTRKRARSQDHGHEH
jgi:hypothetical protein